MSGRRTWTIHLGEATSTGGRRRFPNTHGTIEFFVRLNRPPELSPAGLPLRVDFAHGVEVTDWFRSFFSLEYKNGIMFCDGARSANVVGLGPWDHNIGPTTLLPARWYHVAIMWRLDDGKGKMYRRVHLNGVPCDFGNGETYSWWPNALKAAAIADKLVMAAGGRDVSLDELRVSDVLRYGDKERFSPPAKPFAPDEHTLLLMHLDGNMEPDDR